MARCAESLRSFKWQSGKKTQFLDFDLKIYFLYWFHRILRRFCGRFRVYLHVVQEIISKKIINYL